jgi:ArsR family transcriptional regulator, arsenate/arsenite/antimonite-responsive transcriptional repressor
MVLLVWHTTSAYPDLVMAQNQFDRMFKAFADESRIRIVNLLANGELCVCDLMNALNMGQSKISRHLAYLKNLGLVDSRQQGLWSYYSLSKPKGRFHQRLLDCLSTCFDEAMVVKKDEARLKKLRQAKAKCC